MKKISSESEIWDSIPKIIFGALITLVGVAIVMIREPEEKKVPNSP